MISLDGERAAARRARPPRSALRPTARGRSVSPLDSGTRTVPGTSGEIVTGAHAAAHDRDRRQGLRIEVGREPAAAAARRRPCRPPPGPSGTTAAAAREVAERVARAHHVGRQRRRSSAPRRPFAGSSASTVSGDGPGKDARRNRRRRRAALPRRYGNRHTSQYPVGRVSASRQAVVTMPTSAPGRGAAKVDELRLQPKHRLVRAQAAERHANGDPVQRVRTWQRRGGMPRRNDQPGGRRLGDRLRWPPTPARGAGGAAVDEDLEAVQRLGDEQRLSRSGDEDDTGSTGRRGSAAGAGRPAAAAVSRHERRRRSSERRQRVRSARLVQRAYNERLVMNSLPSQGADPKGLV